jgi:hypothetical protein
LLFSKTGPRVGILTRNRKPSKILCAKSAIENQHRMPT